MTSCYGRGDFQVLEDMVGRGAGLTLLILVGCTGQLPRWFCARLRRRHSRRGHGPGRHIPVGSMHPVHLSQRPASPRCREIRVVCPTWACSHCRRAHSPLLRSPAIGWCQPIRRNPESFGVGTTPKKMEKGHTFACQCRRGVS